MFNILTHENYWAKVFCLLDFHLIQACYCSSKFILSLLFLFKCCKLSSIELHYESLKKPSIKCYYLIPCGLHLLYWLYLFIRSAKPSSPRLIFHFTFQKFDHKKHCFNTVNLSISKAYSVIKFVSHDFIDSLKKVVFWDIINILNIHSTLPRHHL